MFFLVGSHLVDRFFMCVENNKSRVKKNLSLAPAGYVDVSFPLTNEAVNILCALLFSKGSRFLGILPVAFLRLRLMASLQL